MGEMPPRSRLLQLPAEYGTPRTPLHWAGVAERLATAPRYWLATMRPDGRPHSIPVDGLWVDDGLWFGGSTGTVHHANLLASNLVSIHTEDATTPVIVEGEASLVTPDDAHAKEMAAVSRTKYGYAAPAESYRSPMWRVRPHRVLAWTRFPTDATRFDFP